MKKVTALFLALLLIISLAACGNDAERSAGAVASTDPAELIAAGAYQQAYEILLTRGDAASKAELENFVFLPTRTVQTRNSTGDNPYIYAVDYFWDTDGSPLKIAASAGYAKQDTPSLSTEISYEHTQDGYIQMRDGAVDAEATLDANGNLLEYVTYDSAGNIRSEVYTYDEAGNLIKTVTHKSGELYETEDFTYDEMGRMVKERSEVVGNDGASYTTYTYDEKGYLIEEMHGDEADPDYLTTVVYTYDDNGNVAQEYTTYKGSLEAYKSNYTYNEQGQMLTMVQDSTKPTGEQYVSYWVEITYDESGRPVSKQLADYTGWSKLYEWTYDAFGNLIKEISTGSNGDVNVLEHTGYQPYYVPDRSELLEELLMDYQPDIDY